MNNPETLGTKIFLAVLCSTNPKADYPWETSSSKRKFVWRDGSGVVSILMYCENGYYFECAVLPIEEARTYWQKLVNAGWVCRKKKTEELRGFHVRQHAERIKESK